MPPAEFWCEQGREIFGVHWPFRRMNPQGPFEVFRIRYYNFPNMVQSSGGPRISQPEGRQPKGRGGGSMQRQLITARKRSLRRLCFHTCLSVILFTGGSLSEWEGLCPGGLSWRLPPYGNERAVRILLEYILVLTFVRSFVMSKYCLWTS